MKTTINPNIFRAYDIRGIVDKTLTEEAVYLIGRAIGSEAIAQGEDTVIVGRDGRLSGTRLVKNLRKGLSESGCDIIDIGMVPTPLLYFATHVLPSKSGVMLTGSHNPPEYNGIKVVINGETLSSEKIQGLKSRIIDNNLTTGEGIINEEDISNAYLKRVKNDIKLSKPLKVIVDCGNGIPGKIAPHLYRLLGCDVIELYCEVDGNFPNHHPDPSVLKNLQSLIEKIKTTDADIGLAFDGDGDRLGLVTPKGKVIFADYQMMVFAVDVLSRNLGAEILFDVKCTSILPKVISEHAGKPLMWKTGHSFIKAKMRETGALLGGEMSGHIFFKERWYGFDDALYAGSRFLEILSKTDISADELFSQFPHCVSTPELKLEIEENIKFDFIKRFKKHAKFPGAKLTTIDGIRADFDEGWGLIRASNTTPYLVLRFEAKSETYLKQIQKLFREQLLNLDNSLKLPF